MFLKNIQLTNFKCHENLTMDFSTSDDKKQPPRKTTFLMGENGTGKTALLQAIALVTGGSEALYSVPGIPGDYIKLGKAFCEINATITTAKGEERFLSLRMDRNASVAEVVANARITLAPMNAALVHTDRSYFTAGYGSGRRLDTDRRISGLQDSRNTRYAAVHSLFSKDSLLRPPDEWVYEARNNSGRADGSLAALQEALNTFLPQEVRLQSFSEDGRLLFDTPDGVLPLEALSNGYQQTVAWVSNLLYHVTRTFGDYKNPLAARGLLLIDEIDLHLHPAWQRQLYRFLTNGLPQFQVITTTYSPLTVQEAATDELYLLQRQVGSISLLPVSEDVLPVELPQTMAVSPVIFQEEQPKRRSKAQIKKNASSDRQAA